MADISTYQFGLVPFHYLSVPVDLTVAAWQSVADHRVFTVTGLVRLRVLVQITEAVASGGALTFDLINEVEAFNWSAPAPLGLFGTPSFLYESGGTLDVSLFLPEASCLDAFSQDNNYGYRINAAAATDGSLVFHGWWVPISAGATVVAGVGGAM